MTLADPIPELSVVMVSDQQGTIVHVHRSGRHTRSSSAPPRGLKPSWPERSKL